MKSGNFQPENQMASYDISYEPNSKKISIPNLSEITDDVERYLVGTEVEQINKLFEDVCATNKEVPDSPQPNMVLSGMIKKMFENGVNAAKQQKFEESIKLVTLAIEMSQRKRAYFEAFAVQLQELQFMVKQRVDLYLLAGRFLDALMDVELLQNTGMNVPDLFIRKAEALVQLGREEEAKVEINRGLCFERNNMKLRAMLKEVNRRLGEWDIEF